MKLNGSFPRLFRLCRQINKKLLIAVTTSNLSSLYELQSKELHEKDKKLEALRHQPPRWSHQTSLKPAIFISLYKYWLSLKIGKRLFPCGGAYKLSLFIFIFFLVLSRDLNKVLWKLLMKSWLSYMMLCKKSPCGFLKFNYVFKHLNTIQSLPLVSSISILATSWRRQYLWCSSAV